jgi:hypothetical protein
VWVCENSNIPNVGNSGVGARLRKSKIGQPTLNVIFIIGYSKSNLPTI